MAHPLSATTSSRMPCSISRQQKPKAYPNSFLWAGLVLGSFNSTPQAPFINPKAPSCCRCCCAHVALLHGACARPARVYRMPAQSVGVRACLGHMRECLAARRLAVLRAGSILKTKSTTETRRKPTPRERSTKRRGAKKTTDPEEHMLRLGVAQATGLIGL